MKRLAAVVTLIAVATASAGAVKTFHSPKFTITFTYPSTFTLTSNVKFGSSAGSGAVANAAVALDRTDTIALSRYDLNMAVTKQNEASLKVELDKLLSQNAGRTLHGRYATYGGLLAVAYPAYVLAGQQNHITFVFDGRFDYEINCGSTLAHRAEVEAACRTVLASVRRA